MTAAKKKKVEPRICGKEMNRYSSSLTCQMPLNHDGPHMSGGVTWDESPTTTEEIPFAESKKYSLLVPIPFADVTDANWQMAMDILTGYGYVAGLLWEVEADDLWDAARKVQDVEQELSAISNHVVHMERL